MSAVLCRLVPPLRGMLICTSPLQWHSLARHASDQVHECDTNCLLCGFRAEETAKKQAIRAAKAEAQKKDRAGFKVSAATSSPVISGTVHNTAAVKHVVLLGTLQVGKMIRCWCFVCADLPLQPVCGVQGGQPRHGACR